jgi:hypothetical protein
LLNCLCTFALAHAALTPTAFAQTDSPASAFDVADVHASPPGIRDGGIYLHANRLEMHGVTMCT